MWCQVPIRWLAQVSDVNLIHSASRKQTHIFLVSIYRIIQSRSAVLRMDANTFLASHEIYDATSLRMGSKEVTKYSTVRLTAVDILAKTREHLSREKIMQNAISKGNILD